MRSIPAAIHTGFAPIDAAWRDFASVVVGGDNAIAIDDNDDALNWDGFLGRSVSFDVSPGLPRWDLVPDFGPLRERGLKLADLADLWRVEPLRDHLLHRREEQSTPAAQSCQLLLTRSGAAGALLCDAFRALPKSSSHWSVRALLQNSAALEPCGFSFRRWLERECAALGEAQFPPPDFRRLVVATSGQGLSQVTLEHALAALMGRVFHRVGESVAAHILSDWQLGLWLHEKTAVFDLYPYDSHHRWLAQECPGVPEKPAEFVRWWHELPGCAELPPRIASACAAYALVSLETASQTRP